MSPDESLYLHYASARADGSLLVARTFSHYDSARSRSYDGGAIVSFLDPFGRAIRGVELVELASGGPVVTHTYTLDWPVFNVSVTATGSSGSASQAVRWGVQVRALSGHWEIRDAEGSLLLGATVIRQDGTSLSGAEIWPDCRVYVTGSVAAQRAVSLAYRREGSGCRPGVPPVVHVLRAGG